MDLELVQGAFELPALRVQGCELVGRRLLGIEDRRQEAVAGPFSAGVVEGVLDDAYRDAVARPVAPCE